MCLRERERNAERGSHVCVDGASRLEGLPPLHLVVCEIERTRERVSKGECGGERERKREKERGWTLRPHPPAISSSKLLSSD